MSHISRRQLAEIIGEKSLTISDRDKLVKAIAEYLSHSNRKVDINSLTRDVMIYRAENNLIEAVVKSAHGLPKNVVKDIEYMLKEHFPNAKKIIINQKIDTSLVGGVRIEMPSEDLDLSVKAKLNRFKRLTSEGEKI